MATNEVDKREAFVKAQIDTEISILQANNWLYKSRLSDWSSKLGSPIQIAPDKDINFPELIFTNDELDSGNYGVYRNERIYQLIKRYEADLIWEIGAGNGDVSIFLQRHGIPLIAVEPFNSGAVRIARSRILTFVSSLSDLQLPGGVCKNIGVFDVIEHIEDDKEFLRLLHFSVKDGGLLFVSVPAHQWLFSKFDTDLGHFRRYSKSSLRRILKDVGFEVLEIKYFMKLFVLPALFIRKLMKIGVKKHKLEIDDELTEKFGLVNSRFLIKIAKGFDYFLPNTFGLSLLVVAQKITFPPSEIKETKYETMVLRQ